MAICSFCGRDERLTREHIWSNIVLRLFDEEAPLTVDERRGIIHGGDPLIKDLCQDCNSGMGDVDAAMGAFAGKHLTEELVQGSRVEFADPNLLRWVMKTASNHERCLGTNATWWQHFVDFFIGKDVDTSNVDVFLAPWKDLSPGQIETQTGGVLTLGAHSFLFAGLRNVDPKHAHSHTESTWALKVGFGVFALIVWKENVPSEIRDSIAEELREYGWLQRGEDDIVGGIPFNMITSKLYYIPSAPDEVDPLGLMSRHGDG